ncbi:transglycosylase SLT domain containing protein expressed [Zea mays]|uniref:Transglycosylase SLT domain containing protein expressed n=1 Tax=Zea mays TaxID=4577 RepID=A0A1D6QSB8_MAIZE|nr:transglycosylase SLT domain containing protein expressed [Zea mays]
MAVSFKYWDDCLDPEDMRLMWQDPVVSKEWNDAGEEQGQKVHLSRDPDGEAYLTQTEMMAVAAITVHRHFKSQLDPYMIGALAEIASGRRLFVDTYDRKTKETKVGILQVAPEVAQWLGRELGYKSYDIEDNTNLLYWPLVNVYFGAAYAKWLFSCDDRQRTEEFVVRAYKGGKKKAAHKSTSPIFQRYLYVKENLLSIRQPEICHDLAPDQEKLSSTESQLIYWDSKVSEADMDAMWKHPDVYKEWIKSGERRGNVRFSHDAKNRPYLSRVEVKAVAEIIISRHLSTRGVKPEALAALAEVCSMRFVHGVSTRTGLMGIDYPTAVWLSRQVDCGYRAYTLISVDDLYNPFASMYFGASYLAWLSQYEGREQSYEFIVQAYLGGPENVSLQETGPFWNQFLESLTQYQDPKKYACAFCLTQLHKETLICTFLIIPVKTVHFSGTIIIAAVSCEVI